MYLFHLAGPLESTMDRAFRELTRTRSSYFNAPAARRLAIRIIEHLESTYDQVDARLYSPDIEDPQALYWMIDVESTSIWESFRRRLLADDTYIELMREGHALFHEDAESDLLARY